MMIIRFAAQESKRKALGYIARRFPGQSWAAGEVMVPEAALPPSRRIISTSRSKAPPRMSASRRYEDDLMGRV
jgi:hypothetical protein